MFLKSYDVCLNVDPDQDLMLQVSPSQAVVATGDSITLTCSAASPSSFR